MLTHTIRALSLLALIAVAHMLRPFSLNNVTVFAASAITSVAQLLPEQTWEHWQDFGSLAALVTGNPAPFTNRFANVAEKASTAKADLALVQLGNLRQNKSTSSNQAGHVGRRMQRTASYEARRQNNLGGVPLPHIPGLESSLLSNPSLMAFPPLITAESSELSQHSFGVFGLRQQLNSFEQDDESVSEESSWLLETVVQKPIPTSTPNLTFRMITPLQRVNSSAQACPRPVKSTKGIVSTKGQSC